MCNSFREGKAESLPPRPTREGWLCGKERRRRRLTGVVQWRLLRAGSGPDQKGSFSAQVTAFPPGNVCGGLEEVLDENENSTGVTSPYFLCTALRDHPGQVVLSPFEGQVN